MRNFLIFKFSRRTRFKLAIAFTVINVVQILLGILTTGWSIYICLSVSKHLYSEKAEITFVFTVTGMYGTHIIFQYLIGIKICEKCFNRAHKRSTKKHLYFWLATCCNTIVNIMILASMTVRISKHIVRSIRHSMEKGMRHYLKDPVWKHTIDRWQYNMQCCGVNDFKDWYELSWLDKYIIDVNSPMAQNLLLSKDHLHFPVVPWSCCDFNFPMQCFHDPLQQVESSHIWKEQPDFLKGAIFNRGCLEVIRTPIEVSLIGFIIIASILFTNQVVIIVISRFLYTSCRSAVVLRQQFGDAPGWLFSRDFLSDVKGRTVSEVMFDLGAYDDAEEKTDDEYDTNTSTPRTPKEKLTNFLKRVKKKLSPNNSARDPVSSGEETALMLYTK